MGGFDDIQKASKDSIEQAMKSVEAMNKGIQALAVETADYQKKSYETGAAALEKILAAKRAGIKEIILSADNRKDIEDIDLRYTKGMRFTYVTEMIEVVKHALLKEKVENALKVA